MEKTCFGAIETWGPERMIQVLVQLSLQGLLTSNPNSLERLVELTKSLDILKSSEI
jgi:hypothetical protein